MKTLFTYEIPRRATQCCVGGEPFTPGMIYYTHIENSPEGHYVRHDYCEACFQKLDKAKKMHWKASVPKPHKAPKTNAAREEIALNLLRSKECDPEEAFVLGLYLARRKKIALRKDTGDILFYEVLATEEMLPIHKMPLSELAIDQIQKRLLAKFNG